MPSFSTVCAQTGLTSPSYGTIIYGDSTGSDTITFTWGKGLCDYYTYYVNSANFEATGSTQAYSVGVEVSATGSYSWYVSDWCIIFSCWLSEASALGTCTGIFTYCHMPPVPTLITPASGSVIPYASSITFQWSSVAYSLTTCANALTEF